MTKRRAFEAELRELAEKGFSIADLAEALGKDESSIRSLTNHLSINVRVHKTGKLHRDPWEPWEIDILADPSYTYEDIMEETKRSYDSIYIKAYRLKLTKIRPSMEKLRNK